MTRKALGRGLEALIPTRPIETLPHETHERVEVLAAATVPHEVSIESIVPNRFQPRQEFDAQKLEELAESVRQNGILQPLLVSPRGEGFELVAGERRLRAARLAGLRTVPVYVRDVDARESLKLSILENVQREDLNPMEECYGYRRLIEEFGMTQLDLAQRLGKSRSAVANVLRLANLPEELQRRIRNGELTSGHARALLSAGSIEEQSELAALVRERGLSVRDLENLTQAGRRRAPRKPRREVPANPALQELERRLETRLGTRVRIRARKPDGSAGRIEIEYYSAADLERVFEVAGAPYLL
jgi:ParB family chromosome partitioning protein